MGRTCCTANRSQMDQKVTFWNGPLGKRTRGRLITRWEDDIKAIAGPNWRQVAEDRVKWAPLEEAFTHSGVPVDSVEN